MLETSAPSMIDLTGTAIAPIVRELPADLETPVSVYMKLRGSGASFLLESVTGGEQVARYSFIGVQPSRAYVLRDGCFYVHDLQDEAAGVEVVDANGNPLQVLRSVLAAQQTEAHPGLPRFSGGLVGYMGYEIARYFEPALELPASAGLPEAIFLQADIVAAFDHAYGRLLLIANPRQEEGALGRIAAQKQLDEIERRLSTRLPDFAPELDSAPEAAALESNRTRQEFEQAVEQAKEYIAAGDIFQVVLSQRLSRKTTAPAFEIYRALRRLNPSPYMFFFDFQKIGSREPLYLIGASPEMHVRLEGRLAAQRAALRPIAGTRPRGQTPAEDLRREQELLADPKERAEHVMLVDLARNDLGRVCKFGTLAVPEMITVERYSHVMHIVSQVEGELKDGVDALDLLQATFPAGTVSGAPKIRAMQIIQELEGEGRGVYAGAVGYFAYDGSMDTCITIRTLVMQGESISVQAGAGIVADSQPELEYQETMNKARALAAAVEIAESGARAQSMTRRQQ
jgi:anthranilate synthase component 1